MQKEKRKKETGSAECQPQMFELHSRVLEQGILVILNIVERVSENRKSSGMFRQKSWVPRRRCYPKQASRACS